MTDEDERRDAQDEVARLRELMGALGMTAPLPEDGPGADPAEEATAREIARIVALPRIAEVGGAVGPQAPAGVPAPLDLAAARARRRRRWVTATSGAAAAVLVAVGLTVLPQQDQTAVATAAPPMLALPIDPTELAHGGGGPARDALLELAAAAREQPDPAPAGEVQHALSQSWLLSVASDDGTVATTVDPTIVESWLSPDGSTVQAEWRGDPLEADGSLEAVDTSPAAAAVDRLPAGTFDAGAVAALSTEPVTLRRELLGTMLSVDCSGDSEPFCLYVALTDLSDRYVVPSGTEAALWTVLADTPGVTLAGEVTDRIGRRSLAVAVPGNPVEADETVRVLLIDVETGRLSGREEVTLSSDLLGISEPTVTQFRYQVTTDWVDRVGGPATGD